MPFSKHDCAKISTTNPDFKSCSTFENEALLPNLATSQVYSTLDKIKDYETHMKNNYQENKLNSRPSPEESEYFYDDYVDYPYNETFMEHMNDEFNHTNKLLNNNLGNTPTLYAAMKNTTKKTGVALKVPIPNSGFTFFGVPLPSIDMGKLLNTGRKIDWTENKNNQPHTKKYQVTEPPRFETGGFSPMLPTTSDGFMPIPGPTIGIYTKEGNDAVKKNFNSERETQSISDIESTSPITIKANNTLTHKKIKSERHQLESYNRNDNKTQIMYNKTKNIEEQNMDPLNLRKYNLREANITISFTTEKEGIITTDTADDISMQGWPEINSSTPVPSVTSTLTPTIKSVESRPTALSAILLPSSDIIDIKNSSRAATITKVNMPHAEHYDLHHNYSPVVNREAKTRFSEIESSGTNKQRHIDNHEWYYKDYNKSNLEPYVAPEILASLNGEIALHYNNYVLMIMLILLLIVSK